MDSLYTTVDVCYETKGFIFVRCVKEARFVDQIGITPGTFSAGGDSGSLIVTENGNNPVGLLFAGSNTQTFANPIELVLQRFGVTVDDCSGTSLTTYYVDFDSDNYGDPNISIDAESQPDGYVSDNTDCDDTDPTINPGATEICDDGVDNNCDGLTDQEDEFNCPVTCTDNDSDGYCYDIDCDDNNPTINPGATEICDDGIDQDCNGSDLSCPICLELGAKCSSDSDCCSEDCNPELHLLNSYDITWPFIVLIGSFRFVCANGLVVGKKYLHLRKRHIYHFDDMDLNEQVSTALKRFKLQANQWKKWAGRDLTEETYKKVIRAMKFGKKAMEEIEKRAAEEGKDYTDKKFPIMNLWIFFNVLTWYITHRAVSLNHRFEMEKRLRSAMRYF